MKRNLIFLTAAAMIAAVPFAAQAAPAETFLADAIQGSNAEIMMGKLAQERAASAKVRAFGATLETDHTKAKAMAVDLAGSAGVTAPEGVTPEAQAEYDKLKALSGTAFDHAFAGHMAMEHKKVIAQFEDQAKTGDAATAKFAKTALPDLKKHLATAQSLH